MSVTTVTVTLTGDGSDDDPHVFGFTTNPVNISRANSPAADTIKYQRGSTQTWTFKKINFLWGSYQMEVYQGSSVNVGTALLCPFSYLTIATFTTTLIQLSDTNRNLSDDYDQAIQITITVHTSGANGVDVTSGDPQIINQKQG